MTLRKVTLAALVALAGLVSAPAALWAQADALPATLIADNISFYRATTSVTASGNVEVFYEGSRLRAGLIRYEGQTDRITVEGPITLTDAEGGTVVFAEFAQMSADLQNGVLQSARMVLDRQLQIAATEINRVDGRYTQMYQTVASSCEVCAANPVPLWQIRARRVVHDQEEQQLYFEGAQFRVIGVPIAYIPRLRLPDPTLERATGFLIPELRASNQLGTGIRLPYFIAMGDHTDLTLTPYVTLGETQTLEARFRRAFVNGFIEINGALSWDDLTDRSNRSYVFAEGWFDLPLGFRMDFDYQAVSDPDYLLTYGFSEEDSLSSGFDITRTSRNQYIGFGMTDFESLREGDDNFTLPTQMIDGEITQRVHPALIGGIATFGLTTHSHHRQSSAPTVGRDVARIGLDANWRRDWILPAGLLAAIEADWQGDIYTIHQDPAFPDTIERSTPYLAAELRWPLARAGQNGVTHLLEPVLQYVWAPDTGTAVPNEDGAIVEFDEGNLFSLNRFPGADGQELGARLAYGLAYTRDDPDGWSLGLSFGQVLRNQDYGQFTRGSGLQGDRSDLMVSASLSLGETLRLMNRAIVDDNFNVSSNELWLSWQTDQLNLGSSMTWLEADAAEGRTEDMAEWAFDAAYDFDNAWAAGVDWRYDFAENEPTRAGLSLTYATECVDIEFSLSHRFTSSATLPSDTDIGLSVSLNGFGASRDGRRYDRSCRM